MRTFTQKLAFLVLAMLCCVGLQVKAQELTVADGTATNSYLPIYGLYVDTQGTQGQCLYPASLLTNMAGSTISQLTFYLSSSAAAAWTATINVSLGETNDASLSTTFVSDGLTQVYSGTLNATGPTLTVVFATPFVYLGGNLIVDFYVASTGNYKSSSFLGTDQSVADLGHYAYSSTNTVVSFLPKITFEYEASGSCKRPSTFEVSDITENEATLSWDGEAGFFTVEYKAASSEIWLPLLESTPLLTATISELQPNTAYDARVIGVCGEQESGERKLSFRTACGAYSVATSGAYEDDFESYSATAASANNGTSFGCWETGPSTGMYIPHVANSGSYGYYVHSGSKCLSFYGSGNCYAALPIFADELNTLRVSFWGRMESASNGTLALGYITSTDPGDWSSFQVIETYTSSTTMTQYETYLDAIPAEAARLVIRWYYSSQYSCAIDDIKVSRIPTCMKPKNLAVVPGSIAKNSIQLGWENTTPAEAWKVQYKKSSATDWTTVDADTNPFEISGLEAFTAYNVRVAAVCDPDDATDGTSDYSDAISFKTAAGVPFVQNFNSYYLPSDWSRYAGLWDVVISDPDSLVATTSGWATSSTNNGVFPDSTYHLKLNVGGVNCRYWLVSPVIEMEANQQLTFDLAITTTSGNLNKPEVGKQEDDKFIVLISRDGGQTWEERRVWASTESENFDKIACSANGQSVAIDLSDCAGDNIRIAFYGESTDPDMEGDNYLHMRNIRVDEIPACAKPLTIDVAGVTAETAELVWDAGEATAWVLQYSNNADMSDSTEVAVSNEASIELTGLTSETKYYARVKAVCDAESSDWTPIVSFVPSNAVSLTLNDGTYTNDYVPVNGYNVDGLVQSQFVIPAANLTSAQWGDIVRLTFYGYGSNYSSYLDDFDWGSAQFEVYVTEVPSTTISSAVDWASMTKVMNEGSLSIADRQMLVQFDTPYQYQGGNLLIGIKQTVEGTYTTSYWYGVSATGASIGGTSPTQQNFLPKVTVAYVPGEAPDCVKPANLQAVLTYGNGSVATIKWEDEFASEWVLQYSDKASFADSIEVSLTGVDSVNLEGLTPETKYYARVKAICGEDNESDWSDVLSFTPTSAMALTINNGTATNSYVPLYGYYADYGTGSQFIIPADSLVDVQWGLIKQLTFYANTSSASMSGDKFNIYFAITEETTLSDLVDWTTLTEVAVSASLSVNGNKMVITLDAPYEYFGGNLLVGIRETIGGAYTSQFTWQGVAAEDAAYYYYSSYDGQADFLPKMTIDYIPGEEPDCYKATGLAIATVTTTGVTATWDDEEDGAWKYAVALASAGEPAGEAFIAVANDTVEVNGLTDNTAYIFYLRKDCGESVSESILKPFHTKQVPVSVPFADDFEDGNKWLFVNGEIQNAWVLDTAAHTSGTHALYISRDGGVTNSYFNSKDAMVYATKAFTFSEGIYVFKYDWKGVGESSYDFLRVALVPDSIELEAGTSAPFGFSSSALPAGWIALDGGSQLCTVSEWDTLVSPEISVKAGDYNVVFAWRNDGGYGTNPPAAVDNFSISKISCSRPSGLAISDINAAGAKATWKNEEGAVWQYAVALASAGEPADEAFIELANDSSVVVEGLAENSAYIFYLRKDCGEDGLSMMISAPFRTKQMPVAVPFADDFENGNNWMFFNGELENAWVVDTAAHNGGTHALYISNDKGLHNAYSNNKSAMVYATKAFTFDSTSYIFSYQWKGYGESSSDYLRVALVPDSLELAAGTSAPSGFSSSALPAGWIALDKGSKLNLKSAWDTITTAEIPVKAGTYKVVFAWRNDGSLGTNPPAAVDNFSITEVACPMQSNLVIPDSTITSTSVMIHWKAGNAQQDAWQIAYDTIANNVPDSVSKITIVDVTTNPFELTDLLPNKTYYVTVRAKCGDEEFSQWLPRKYFTTAKSCAVPTGLAASELTSSSAKINWNTFGVDSFNVRYTKDTIWIDSLNIAGGQLILNGLEDGTTYKLQVQPKCDTTQWSSVLPFTTKQIPATVPFADDFENGSKWLLVNGSQINAWVVDTAAHNGVGKQAIYISNDGGKHNAYNISSTTMVYAKRLITIADSMTYNFQYDWIANGEGSYDYLRVALVPDSIELEAGTTPSGFATSTLPAKWIALDGGSKLNGVSAWQTQSVDIAIPAGSYNIVLAWKNDNSTGTNPPAAVDNFSITPVNCFRPTALTVSEIEVHSAVVSWTIADTTQTAWQIAISDVQGFNPDTLSNLIDADTISYSLIGLEENTTYYVCVRANCGDEDGVSKWSPVQAFTTKQLPVSLPFADDFEEGNKWNLINGSQVNAWVVDTAAHNGGTHALYISNDDGKHNAYTLNSTSVVYATKLIAVDEDGKYIFKYDWRSVGESASYAWDYMRVALAPADVQLTAGTAVSNLSSSLPAGWIALDGGVLKMESEWQHKEIVASVDSGEYKIVIAWNNDASTGNQTPAAIDNFSVELKPCVQPSALAAANITPRSATISWTNGAADQDAWQLAISTEEGFDPDEVEPIDALSNPYELAGLNAETTYYLAVRANCGDGEFSAWSPVASFTTLPMCTVMGESLADTLCIGETFTWKGKEYSEAGTYYDTLISVAGCDSVDMLVLSFYEAEPDTIYAEASITRDELPFIYADEEHPLVQGTISYDEFTAAGVYMDTVLAFGEHCTAVLVHKLIVTACEEVADAEEVVLCPGDGYPWHGKIYGEPGTYRDTIHSAVGCDTVKTLIVALHKEDTIFVEKTIKEDELPFTYQNAEHPYIEGQDSISFPVGTSLGEHKATALVEGEHCTAVLELTLTVEKSQGIDEIFSRDGKKVQKVLYRDILYIVVDNEWYNAEGKKVNKPE